MIYFIKYFIFDQFYRIIFYETNNLYRILIRLLGLNQFIVNSNQLIYSHEYEISLLASMGYTVYAVSEYCRNTF